MSRGIKGRRTDEGQRNAQCNGSCARLMLKAVRCENLAVGVLGESLSESK